jgi:hypothetical protein
MSLEHEAVYLIGPMTGYPSASVIAPFATVHAAAKEHGARVIYDPAIKWLTTSPMGCDMPTREDWMRDAIHELTRTQGLEPYYDVAVCIPDDVTVLADADVALLLAIADACGIWVVDAEELEHERR